MKKRPHIWFLVTSGVLFGIYLLNIILGKAALLADSEPIFALGDVGEFLALLGAMIFFVIEVLRREARAAAVDEEIANDAKAEEKGT